MKSFYWIPLWVACLFLILVRFAHATVMPPSSSGNVTTYGAGVMSAADLATAAISRASDSSLQVQKNIDLVVEGRAAVVQGISKPLPKDYAKIAGNFARGVGGAALKTAGWVYAAAEAGKALNDLCNDLGFSCYKGADQSVLVTRSPVGKDQCVSILPTPEYFGGGACSWSMPYMVYDPYITTNGSQRLCAAETYCSSTSANYPNLSNDRIRSGSLTLGPVPSQQNAPSTLQELEDAIASQSGWPSTSSLPKVIEQAIASGETLPVPAPTKITGPSSIPGPTKTETTPAQNGKPQETKTTSTTYNITYEGNKVTTNNTTTTVINNGDTITTTTEESEPEPSPSDSPNPDLPKLYTRKYPDGLTGVWTQRKAELMATPLPSLIQSFAPTITSGAGCPQFSIPLNIGPWQWGTYALGPACYVWDFLKVCVILGASFLARALVFGG